MTPEQITRNQIFLEDLRANSLKTTGQMRDDEGGRCCLCVALDTAIKLGYKRPPRYACDILPPDDINDFYGWEGIDPLIGADRKYCASSYNDGISEDGMVEMKTHKQIADLFEEAYPEVVKKSAEK
jgi:hypothetical protein